MLLRLLLAVLFTAAQAQVSPLQLLQDFRDSVTDPDGKLSNWTGVNYWSWQGVTCDALGSVVKLDVSFPPGVLSGTLPVGLQQLTSLTEVHFEFNAFTGTLPAAWAAWTGLAQFYAQSNNLTGALPSEWSAWVNVTQISLQSNALSGLLPSSWSSMSKLVRLNLVSNRLLGSLPSQWPVGMTSMFRLNLDSNSQVCGSLPGQWAGKVTYSGTTMLTACPSPPPPPAPPPSPGNVLLSLKAGITDDPDNWTAGWTAPNTADQCSWLGVACSDGAVTGLDMQQFNVQVATHTHFKALAIYSVILLISCFSQQC